MFASAGPQLSSGVIAANIALRGDPCAYAVPLVQRAPQGRVFPVLRQPDLCTNMLDQPFCNFANLLRLGDLRTSAARGSLLGSHFKVFCRDNNASSKKAPKCLD